MRLVLFIFILACVASTAMAQPVLTPRNMALGGGGSTYLTDYHANFYNPANLMIQDRTGTFDVGVLTGGFYFDGVQNYSDPQHQFDNVVGYLKSYQPGSYAISEPERKEILADNYPRRSHLSKNRTRYDATLLGLKWKRKNQAMSLAFRTRTSSYYQTGRGWYSNKAVLSSNDQMLLNRSLIHRYQTLHEISFGYAESFKFLTRLTSRLDNFIIGIAPKLVFGGAYQDAVWENKFYSHPETNQNTHIQSFSYAAAGSFGTMTSNYMKGASAETALTTNYIDDMFSVDGIGAGLDIGVTYLLTLGSDLSAVRPGSEPTQKSLRLSFSMTDIGFVSYSNNETNLKFFTDTTANATVPTSTAQEAFIGSRGQYFDFIEKHAEVDNPFLKTGSNGSGFSTLLPMALHGGALLEINRIKMMGDISIGLTKSAFNSPTIISSFGVELRPFLFLPLRAGAQFEAERPNFLSVGSAIETKRWDFSVAAQFTPNSLVSQPKLKGISMATLQFHF